MATSKKVFCSYRSVDKPEVEAFARRLRTAAGVDAWFDAWEVLAGDNIVHRMNEGLQSCDAALVFISARPWPGRYFGAEVSALTALHVEENRRVIVVMIDAAADVPPLLRALSRRSIDEFDDIVAAIHNSSARPSRERASAASQSVRFTLRLQPCPEPGLFDIYALRDGQAVGELRARSLRDAMRLSLGRHSGGVWKDADGASAVATSAPARHLAELGRAVGALLFAGDVGRSLRQALSDLNVVRPTLDLHFESADARLLALPFEAALLDGLPGHDTVAPALMPGVVVRRIVASAPPPSPLPAAAHPLKILVAVGAPDEGRSPNPVLDLEAELQNILNAVAPRAEQGAAQVRFLEVGHPDQIRRALGIDAYHVLHLSGHGSADGIELEDEDGFPVPVDAGQLAQALRAAGRNVPLIFLSSCHGGAASASGAGGLAFELVRAGVPHVVAMQAEVTDGYAAELAKHFYERLAQPDQPDPARALATARTVLEAERRKTSRSGTAAPETVSEFATATLYCAQPGVPLIDHSVARQDLAAPPVHQIGSDMWQLDIGNLIGRRIELRRALRVLRRHEKPQPQLGARAGVVLTGIGGVGKSSLASRVMTRLREDGWIVAVVVGRFNIAGVAARVGASVLQHTHAAAPDLSAWGAVLRDPLAADQARMEALCGLLQSCRLLLVLDNFEDNLALGGGAFNEPAVQTWLEKLAEHARCGQLLFTCRYPLPDLDHCFDHQPLPALSHAQVRKLLWRRDRLRALKPEEVTEVLRLIGGHPRMLEFLDAILGGGRDGRFVSVITRLKKSARAAGVDLDDEETIDLSDAVRASVLVGARDVLLDELLALAQAAGDDEVLLQCAVSNLPIDAAGVAYALGDAVPEAAAVKAVRRSLKRLADLSLVTAMGDAGYWVHRWTAEALAHGPSADPEAHRERCMRAARYRQ